MPGLFSDGVVEILLDALPVEVGEEIFHVDFFARRLIVGDEGVLPHVEGEYGRDAWQMTKVLFVYPILDDSVRAFVVSEHSPAYAAGSGEILEYLDGSLKRPLFRQSFIKRGVRGEGRWSALEVPEIVFVIAHAAEFKPLSAIGLPPRIFWIVLVLDNLVDEIEIVYVAGVELEVFFDCLCRYAFQGRDVEFLFFEFFHNDLITVSLLYL